MPCEMVPISTVHAPFMDGAWSFADNSAQKIAQFWAEQVAQKPKLFNGKVLIAENVKVTDAVLNAHYRAVDYAAFLYYLRSGKADGHALNIFAMAALTSADGALIMGKMAAHTANGGRIYFPAGTPDLDDVKNGVVDLDNSVRRELYEETGLCEADITWGEGWQMFASPLSRALMKQARSSLNADALVSLLAERMSATDGELSAYHVVRSSDDIIEPAMPPYVAAYARLFFTDNRNGF